MSAGLSINSTLTWRCRSKPPFPCQSLRLRPVSRVDPDALAICAATGVPGTFDRLYPRGRLPYPDDFLSGGIAYSVFTHLSEEAHLHWMHELGRVLRPGAVFCMTLEPRRFVDFIEQMPDNPASPWHTGLKRFAGHADNYREQFDAGHFVYLPTGGGIHRQASEYGDAIAPPAYIKRQWGTDLPYAPILITPRSIGKRWPSCSESEVPTTGDHTSTQGHRQRGSGIVIPTAFSTSEDGQVYATPRLFQQLYAGLTGSARMQAHGELKQGPPRELPDLLFVEDRNGR
jgi:hypothetical protein